MLITMERTTLNRDGKEVVIINPNTPFKPMEFKIPLTVTSYARIMDENGKTVCFLQAGQKVTSIGEVIKPKPRLKIEIKKPLGA